MMQAKRQKAVRNPAQPSKESEIDRTIPLDVIEESVVTILGFIQDDTYFRGSPAPCAICTDSSNKIFTVPLSQLTIIPEPIFIKEHA